MSEDNAAWKPILFPFNNLCYNTTYDNTSGSDSEIILNFLQFTGGLDQYSANILRILIQDTPISFSKMENFLKLLFPEYLWELRLNKTITSGLSEYLFSTLTPSTMIFCIIELNPNKYLGVLLIYKDNKYYFVIINDPNSIEFQLQEVLPTDQNLDILFQQRVWVLNGIKILPEFYTSSTPIPTIRTFQSEDLNR